MGESMTDLFDSATEAYEERIAIQSADAIEIDHETERHRCEVQWVIRAYYPNSDMVADYLKAVKKQRGKEAADKLRPDLREAWKRRRECES